jgi:hypothetical protein
MAFLISDPLSALGLGFRTKGWWGIWYEKSHFMIFLSYTWHKKTFPEIDELQCDINYRKSRKEVRHIPERFFDKNISTQRQVLPHKVGLKLNVVFRSFSYIFFFLQRLSFVHMMYHVLMFIIIILMLITHLFNHVI